MANEFVQSIRHLPCMQPDLAQFPAMDMVLGAALGAIEYRTRNSLKPPLLEKKTTTRIKKNI